MKALREGAVRLNGAKASPSDRLAEGDAVSAPWALEAARPPTGYGASRSGVSERLGLRTLYRGGGLWCVDKPAGLLSQPDSAGGDSLVTRAWAELEWGRIDFRPAVIGRLDRNVSGVSAIALDAPALRALSSLMRDGRIKKIYRALARGETPPEGEITVPLLKDGRRNFVRAASAGEAGMEALTRFRRLGYDGRHSLVELELVTGRPHQARAHMSFLGFPIVGDFKYGDRTNRNAEGVPLCLHAFSLSFPDVPGLPEPIRGLTVVSPLPRSFSVFKNSGKR
ncbi:MAG: RluA family pseudouridine synthase [Synergistaceae bacterium]|jgi:23S rRNA pseudouridine955/2504/2580 synthase|nr:RluA family pseudouridine synthase [Synergistaceae bacterium]